jgi:hypothetical protein
MAAWKRGIANDLDSVGTDRVSPGVQTTNLVVAQENQATTGIVGSYRLVIRRSHVRCEYVVHLVLVGEREVQNAACARGAHYGRRLLAKPLIGRSGI